MARRPERCTIGGLNFPGFAPNYLGEQVMDDFVLLATCLEEHEWIVEDAELSPEQVLSYLELVGIFRDLPFVGELGTKLSQHVSETLIPRLSAYYSDPTEISARVREGILDSLMGMEGIANHPLLKFFALELDKMVQVKQLVRELHREEDRVRIAEERGLSNVEGIRLASPYAPELLLQRAIQKMRLTKGHRVFFNSFLIMLFFARFLGTRGSVFSGGDQASIKEKADASFANLRGKDLELTNKAKPFLPFRYTNGPWWLNRFSLYFQPQKGFFEFSTFQVPFQHGGGMGEPLDAHFHCSVSRITGELVPIAHGLTSLRDVFKHYGREADYEFLRMLALRTLEIGLEHGDLVELNEVTERGDTVAVPPSPITEVQLGTLEQVGEASNGIPPRKPKGVRKTIRNITGPDAVNAFRQLGIEVVQGRSGFSNSHLILTRTRPDGTRLTYPFPGVHGMGRSERNTARLICKVLDLFGFSREAFLQVL